MHVGLWQALNSTPMISKNVISVAVKNIVEILHIYMGRTDVGIVMKNWRRKKSMKTFWNQSGISHRVNPVVNA